MYIYIYMYMIRSAVNAKWRVVTKNKQGSDKTCQDLPRSNKVNQRNGKRTPASITCRSE